jgi:5-methylcytosine-specific restriction endonuclease McrA
MTGVYPDDWPQIAARIKDAAGNACEHCGHKHDPLSGHTLTVHHLDGNKSNVADDNLLACCQRCHLHIQARWTPGQGVFEFAVMEWMKQRGI